jgi:predicted small secreted protein
MPRGRHLGAGTADHGKSLGLQRMHLASLNKGLVFTAAIETQTTELTAVILLAVAFDLAHCDGVTTTGEDIPLVVTAMDDLAIGPSIPIVLMTQFVK